jgi:hypothetical protein
MFALRIAVILKKNDFFLYIYYFDVLISKINFFLKKILFYIHFQTKNTSISVGLFLQAQSAMARQDKEL